MRFSAALLTVAVLVLALGCVPAEPPRFPEISFNRPLADQPPDEPMGYSGSAFTLAYRGKVFLVSVAHVVAGPPTSFFFHADGHWIHVANEWKLSTIDLAAVDVSDVYPAEKAGQLKIGRGDLIVGVSRLIAFCNPRLSPTPFVGVYLAKEEFGIELVFSGEGLVHACGGAALVDYGGSVRGIITSGSAKDAPPKLGYAIPSESIARFLDEQFFKTAQ